VIVTLAAWLLISLPGGQPGVKNDAAHQQAWNAGDNVFREDDKNIADGYTAATKAAQHKPGNTARPPLTPHYRVDISWQSFAPLNYADIIATLLLIVTTLYLIATINIWRAMVTANEQADETRKESAAKTEESLRITRESNELTIKTLRAYLMVDDVAFRKTTSDGKPLVEFKIYNAGATVAKVSPSVACMFIGDALPPVNGRPDYAKHAPTAMNSGGYIYSGKPIHQKLSRKPPFDEAAIRTLNSGASLFVFGCIEYADVLGVAHVLGWARELKGGRCDLVRTEGYDYAD
jgi:hypothetical protein